MDQKVERYGLGMLMTIALLLLAYAVSNGLGYTYDSYDYLHAGETFAKDFSMYNANGESYVERAPLFPLLLAISSNPILWTVLNILNFLLCIFLSYKVASQVIENKWVLLVFLGLQVLSTPILMIHSFLWSEPLFMLLHLLFVWYLIKYFEKPTWRSLSWLIVFAFLFALQRTPGIFYIAAYGLSIFLASPNKKTFVKMIGFGMLSSSGWIIWFVRNLYIKGLDYHPATQTAFQNIEVNVYQYTNVLSSWFLPLSLPFSIRAGIVVVVLIGLLGCGLYFSKKEFYKTVRSPLIYSQMMVVVFYTIALLSLEDVGYHESDRYFAMIYFSFFLVFFALLDKLYLSVKVLWQYAIIIILCLWLLYPSYRAIKNVTLWHDSIAK